MIRAAARQDLDAIVALGKRMHSESPRYQRLVFDEAKVYAMFLNAMDDARYFLLVSETADGEITGGFAGFAAEHWCSRDTVAQDLALFVQPDRRGGLAAAQMVKAFAAWAKERGCKQIVLGISTGVRVEETAQLFCALGLKQFGYCFEV